MTTKQAAHLQVVFFSSKKKNVAKMSGGGVHNSVTQNVSIVHIYSVRAAMKKCKSSRKTVFFVVVFLTRPVTPSSVSYQRV